MRLRFTFAGSPFTLEVSRDGEGCLAVAGGRALRADVLRARPGEVTFRLNGRLLTARYAEDGSRLWIAVDGRTFVLERTATPEQPVRRSRAADGAAHSAEVRAEMPGQVRAVLAGEGQAVDKGQPLLLLEAMKMELRVSAPLAGRVRRLLVSEGQVVERGQLLAEVSPPAEA